MIPLIKVRDKSGRVHIVGTDTHDRLVVENNALHYVNLQCMQGTRFGEYEFVGVEGVNEAEFAAIVKEAAADRAEKERKLRAILGEGKIII